MSKHKKYLEVDAILSPTETAKPICRGRKEFIPVDEKEFLSVSDLVRGRAKLQDVNKVCICTAVQSRQIDRFSKLYSQA